MLWLALYFPQLPLEAFTASSYIAGDQRAQVVLEQNRVHLANSAAMSAGIVRVAHWPLLTASNPL